MQHRFKAPIYLKSRARVYLIRRDKEQKEKQAWRLKILWDIGPVQDLQTLSTSYKKQLAKRAIQLIRSYKEQDKRDILKSLAMSCPSVLNDDIVYKWLANFVNLKLSTEKNYEDQERVKIILWNYILDPNKYIEKEFYSSKILELINERRIKLFTYFSKTQNQNLKELSFKYFKKIQKKTIFRNQFDVDEVAQICCNFAQKYYCPSDLRFFCQFFHHASLCYQDMSENTYISMLHLFIGIITQKNISILFEEFSILVQFITQFHSNYQRQSSIKHTITFFSHIFAQTEQNPKMLSDLVDQRQWLANICMHLKQPLNQTIFNQAFSSLADIFYVRRSAIHYVLKDHQVISIFIDNINHPNKLFRQISIQSIFNLINYVQRASQIETIAFFSILIFKRILADLDLQNTENEFFDLMIIQILIQFYYVTQKNKVDNMNTKMLGYLLCDSLTKIIVNKWSNHKYQKTATAAREIVKKLEKLRKKCKIAKR